MVAAVSSLNNFAQAAAGVQGASNAITVAQQAISATAHAANGVQLMDAAGNAFSITQLIHGPLLPRVEEMLALRDTMMLALRDTMIGAASKLSNAVADAKVQAALF